MDPRLQPLADVLVKVLVREILEMQKPSDQEGFGVCVPLDKGDQEREKCTT